jgi:hypothetical protein
MRGGKRENAGRKKGYPAIQAEEARRVFSERIMREIGPIADALISKAKGGDVGAVKELFDRAFGKSYQSVDVTTNGKDLPIPIYDLDSV